VPELRGDSGAAREAGQGILLVLWGEEPVEENSYSTNYINHDIHMNI